MTLEELKTKMKKNPLDSSDLLWENLKVDKIIGNDYDAIDSTAVPEEEKHNVDVGVQMSSSVEVTPNHLVETTLNNTPFNIYQYTDLAIFGHYS